MRDAGDGATEGGDTDGELGSGGGGSGGREAAMGRLEGGPADRFDALGDAPGTRLGRTDGGTLRRGERFGIGGSGGADRRGGGGGGRELRRPVRGVYNCSASEGVECGGGWLSGVAASSSLALMRRGGPLEERPLGRAGDGDGVMVERDGCMLGAGGGGGADGVGTGRISTTGVIGVSHGATPAMAGTAGARGTCSPGDGPDARTPETMRATAAAPFGGGGAVERDEMGGTDAVGGTEAETCGRDCGGGGACERVVAGW